MRPVPTISLSDTIRIRPWPDPVLDSLGHDPRSDYVERYWLGVLGPSTTWLMRLFATTLDEHPEGTELKLHDTAAALGLASTGGRGSPFVRALTRCVQFRLASLDGDGGLAVRRKLPPLNRRQVVRLPEYLQESHRRLQEAPPEARRTVEEMRNRARQLALSLVQVGEDVEATERQLMRWGFHPAICSEATKWAHTREQRADGIDLREPQHAS